MLSPEEIEKKLTENFQNCEVFVVDTTGLGSNFEIRIATPELKDLSRVERHQKIMSLFTDELNEGTIHALTIKYLKPENEY